MNIDELIRSKRKTISIEITHDARLRVRAPLKTPKKVIEDAVSKKSGWILEKQRAARVRAQQNPPKACAQGETFPLLGRDYTLLYDPGAREIAVRGDSIVMPASFAPRARQELVRFYQKQALAVIGARVEAIAAAAHYRYRSLKITGATTRWGSCGPGGRLCFSWRLVMAPPELVDYVAVHELCHIDHPDHSAAFWARVAALMPDCAQRREALRQKAPLMRRDFFAAE